MTTLKCHHIQHILSILFQTWIHLILIPMSPAKLRLNKNIIIKYQTLIYPSASPRSRCSRTLKQNNSKLFSKNIESDFQQFSFANISFICRT